MSKELFGVLVIVALGLGACSAPESGGAVQSTAASTGDLNITLTTQPDPPRAGENVLEVMVTDASGAPVADASAEAVFLMAAMATLSVPDMRTVIPLTNQGGGLYSGKGLVVMAGNWNVTISVTRGGQQIGSRTVPVVAK